MSSQSDCYDFTHRQRGFAVVIVNKNFPRDSGMNKRRGWKKDMSRMKTLFHKLQFRVKCYKDLKGKAMIQKIYNACQDEKNRDADCFACVISTHGNEEPEKVRHGTAGKTLYQHCVYGSDGVPVFINDILDIVHEDASPHLTGKPKLFFIQACRSRHDDSKPKYDYGVVIPHKPNTLSDGITLDIKSTTSSNDTEDLSDQSSAVLHDKATTSSNGVIGQDNKSTNDRGNLPDQKGNQDGCGDFKIVSPNNGCPISETSDWDCHSEDEWNSDDPDSDSDTDPSDTEPTVTDLEDPKASPDTHEPPPLPVDLVPINCPTDCLIMYPVTSGKIAFTNPKKGSYLLSYMYSKMKSLLESRHLLPYLTEVIREVAKYDYNPEYKPKHLTVDEFYNRPLKTSACIVHRLTGDVEFIPKKERAVMQKLKDFIHDAIS